MAAKCLALVCALHSARAAECGGGDSKLVRCAAGWRTAKTGPGPADGTAAGKHELGLELRWKASTAGEAGWDSAVGQQGCGTQTCFMPPRCVPADVAGTNYGTSVQLSADGQLNS